MRIIIINFTRFGDTLQSQPLVHALKAQGHTLAWICLENFTTAVELIEGIDKIFPLPSAKLLAYMHQDSQSKDKNTWHKALSLFEAYIRNVEKQFEADAILNLTPMNIARLIAKRLSMPSNRSGKILPMLGFGLDNDGYMKNSTVWANYIQAVTLNRISSPFNISDGFSLLGIDSLKEESAQNAFIKPIDQEILKEMENFLYTLPFENYSAQFSPKGFIAFQLGASNEVRQWSMKNFADLSQILVKEGYIPVLLGTKEEEHLAEQFYLKGGAAKNALGKTNLHQLAALLTKIALLVTNDTGTMHLAAAVGTPILGIFLATAQPWDTGPVSIDACLVEPNLPCHPCDFSTKCPHNNMCRESIPAKIIGGLIKERLQSNVWQQAFSEHTRIWKSIRDSEGFLSLEPLDIVEKNQRYAIYNMQRIVYKELLNLLAKKAKGEALNPSIPPLEAIGTEESQKLRQNLDACLELFFLLEQQGKLLTTIPRMKQAFLATNQKILIYLKDIKYLVPLSYMWNYGMENYGEDLSSFFEFTEIVKNIMEKWRKALCEE